MQDAQPEVQSLVWYVDRYASYKCFTTDGVHVSSAAEQRLYDPVLFAVRVVLA